jgi:hypothetical protein
LLFGVNRARAADAAAICAILVAGALSTFWVFLVPVFQSPDEPAHFDYAISIYNAHRLINRADGPADWIVSPYTKYLMRVSDYGRIAGHSPMHVPVGYGTHAYFARIDAGAPNLQRQTPSSGRVNYIVRLYPFGFYALEAVWMGAVAALTHSMADVFFAGRILCVLLTMLALYFNYRTALNLGIGRLTSTAIVGAIGLFPMTSLVSAYIQPDNLTYALVSAALFFATQLRNGTPSTARVAPLGLALGLLAITKYHFFISAALPAAFLAAAALLRAKTPGGKAIAVFAWLFAPALALLCLQHWAVDSGTAIGHTAPSDISFEYIRSVIAQGIEPAIRYTLTSLLAVFLGCFVSGICAAGYWQVLGWGDTPIVIGDTTVEAWIRGAIALITLAVAAVVIFYCIRNAWRLLLAGARGHFSAAMSIAAADPVINSYLCFAAIIAALYVITDNVFGVSGRHWYPYIFPAFLCFVWYAPRALTKRHARISAILAGTLLAYSVVAAPYAAIDAARRYYGPDSGRYEVSDPAPGQILGHALGALWPLQDGIYNFAASQGQFSFRRGTIVAVSGAAMENQRTGASNVAVLVDRREPAAVLTRQYLFGIAEALHNVNAGYTGFSADVPTARLGEGAHTVSAYAKRPESRLYGDIAPSRLFFVTDRDGRFSQTLVRDLQKLAHVSGMLRSSGTCRGRVTTLRGILSLPSGSVLLLRGSVAPSPHSRYSALWLLADDRPFPAKFSAATDEFAGLLPTSALSAGIHHVTAYAIGTDGSTDARIAAPLIFQIVPGLGQSEFPADPPPICDDPLKQLAAK